MKPVVGIVMGSDSDLKIMYFDLSHSREAMLRFAHTQLDSSRKSVAKKAARFLQKHEL